MTDYLPLEVAALAKIAARAAFARGDIARDTKVFVRRDEAPDKTPVYSLWRRLPFGQEELVDVLETHE